MVCRLKQTLLWVKTKAAQYMAGGVCVRERENIKWDQFYASER